MTLVHEMQRRDDVGYGLTTMCIGVGQGIAMVVEKPAWARREKRG